MSGSHWFVNLCNDLGAFVVEFGETNMTFGRNDTQFAFQFFDFEVSLPLELFQFVCWNLALAGLCGLRDFESIRF